MEEREEKLLKIFRHYGISPQWNKLQEELLELHQALSCENLETDDIVEEIADVENLIEQFTLTFGWCSRGAIDSAREAKIERTLLRIESERADK